MTTHSDMPAATSAADEQRRRRAADHALACPDPERCRECAAAVVPLAVAVDEALARLGITGGRR
jgi:hypothetical protein